MELDYSILLKNELFGNIPVSDLKSMLSCLNAKTIYIGKDSFILSAGEKVGFVGILLSGRLAVLRENEDGVRSIIETLYPADSFGEAFACAGILHAPVSVMALEDSKVLLIDYRRIVTTCSSSCSFHSKLIENMLSLLAEKLIFLNSKLNIVSKRKTREKLLAFFEQQKRISGSKRFLIPFNREELADYLFVDRSALSAELSKMQKEGLIKFKKNQFEILF